MRLWVELYYSDIVMLLQCYIPRRFAQIIICKQELYKGTYLYFYQLAGDIT